MIKNKQFEKTGRIIEIIRVIAFDILTFSIIVYFFKHWSILKFSLFRWIVVIFVLFAAIYETIQVIRNKKNGILNLLEQLVKEKEEKDRKKES
ncbi:MAG: hypothetical protein LBF32_01065 [Streptococcaceae bacterium]|jgi:uncharacterized protein YacL|nr:hypothetical protein [Streptococcaceae bacterium]